MAKFVVVGAGVVGVASAWQLCQAGHEVVLVDRNASPCGGTSLKNGAQLSYSYCDALASPGLFARMPAILAGHDPAFRVRLQADPRFLLWGLRFLRHATPTAFANNTAALLRIAAATQRLLPKLLAEFPLAFDYAVPGKLVLCEDEAKLAASQKEAEAKRKLGIEVEMLNRAEAIATEPALARYAHPFVGAVYTPNDAVGDPGRFCEGLIAALSKHYRLRTRYRCDARRILKRNGRAVGVVFANYETEPCDGVVVATGYDTALVRSRDRFGSVWPVQGYSATVPASAGSMRVSITDPKRRTVYAPLGASIRIAGIADVGARRFHFDQARFETLRRSAAAAFPGMFDLAGAEGWSDARPCTPSSRPLIDRGDVRGLYLNLAHGAFGWTLSLGSAEHLASLVAEDDNKNWGIRRAAEAPHRSSLKMET